MERQDQFVFWGSAISTIFFGLGYYNYRGYRNYKKDESKFKSQRIYTPDELKSIIDKNEPLVHKLFTRNSEGNQFIGKDLIIQGKINNQDCIKSILEIGNDTQLVLRINYDFPYYTNEDTYKIMSEKTMNSDYYLKKKELGKNVTTKIQPTINLEKNGVTCKVMLTEQFSDIDKQCYDYADSRMVQDDSSPWKFIWNCFGNVVASLHELILKKDIRDLLCFRIKVDNCEIGIRNLGIVSILGDIIYNKDRGELTISKPIRLMKNKLEYLELLKQKINIKEGLTCLFWISSFIATSLTLGLLYRQVQNKTHLTFFGRQYQVPNFIVQGMRRVRGYFNNNRNQSKRIISDEVENEDNQKNKTLESVYTQPRESMECIICYTRCRSVIIRPCLHCSMCQQCYRSLPKKECPVCKTSIRSEVKIYKELEQNQDNNNQVNQNNNSSSNSNQNQNQNEANNNENNNNNN